eukprot:scaffold49330_cov50-Prasinocladus_malaysianus.AAC.1
MVEKSSMSSPQLQQRQPRQTEEAEHSGGPMKNRWLEERKQAARSSGSGRVQELRSTVAKNSSQSFDNAGCNGNGTDATRSDTVVGSN